MDEPRYYHTEQVRKRKTNTIWYHLYVSYKIWHKWTYLWNRNRLADKEQTCGWQEGGEAGKGWIRSSGLTDANWYSWEEGMAAHSSILAWRIPWTEEPGRLQTIGLQRVGHDWSDLACMHSIAGNYIQYPVMNHNRKEYKKNVYICKTESLCCTVEISTTSWN